MKRFVLFILCISLVGVAFSQKNGLYTNAFDDDSEVRTTHTFTISEVPDTLKSIIAMNAERIFKGDTVQGWFSINHGFTTTFFSYTLNMESDSLVGAYNYVVSENFKLKGGIKSHQEGTFRTNMIYCCQDPKHKAFLAYS